MVLIDIKTTLVLTKDNEFRELPKIPNDEEWSNIYSKLTIDK